MAPVARACSCVINSAVTARLSKSNSLTRASTSANTDCGTAPALGKSNLKRPGEFSEPI